MGGVQLIEKYVYFWGKDHKALRRVQFMDQEGIRYVDSTSMIANKRPYPRKI